MSEDELQVLSLGDIIRIVFLYVFSLGDWTAVITGVLYVAYFFLSEKALTLNMGNSLRQKLGSQLQYIRVNLIKSHKFQKIPNILSFI